MKVYVTEMLDDCGRVMEPHVFASREIAEAAGEDVIECELYAELPEPVMWLHMTATFTEGGVLSGKEHEDVTPDYFGDLTEAWWQVFPQPNKYWPPKYVTVGLSAPDTPETREWYRVTVANVIKNFDLYANGETWTRREKITHE